MSKSTPLQPLKVGDRVRVKYTSAVGKPCTAKGTVKYVNPWGGIQVERDGFEGNEDEVSTHHPDHCRRLKKKPRPPKEERVERVERVERFLVERDAPWGVTVSTYSQKDAENFRDAVGFRRIIRMVEIREGEAIVSREALARAWNDNKGCFGVNDIGDTVGREHFREFCEALGLPGKEQG